MRGGNLQSTHRSGSAAITSHQFDLRDWTGWDTTDCAAVINTAIDSVHTSGGGVLLLPKTEMSWGELVRLRWSDVKLRGHGKGFPADNGVWASALTSAKWIGASGGTMLNLIPELSQFTASFSGMVMTVNAVVSGTIAAGDTISINGFAGSYTVASLGTGVGTTGTYNLTASAGTVSSSTCSASSVSRGQNMPLNDIEFSGITLRANNLAANGLLLKSVNGSKLDCGFEKFSGTNMEMSCVPSTSCPFYPADGYPVPGLREHTDNHFNEIDYVGTNYGGAGKGLVVGGLNNGNSCRNNFRKVVQLSGSGIGLTLGSTDTNVFNNTAIWSYGATYSIVLQAGTTALNHARMNKFDLLVANLGIYAQGTEVAATPSMQNYIDYYDDGNTYTAPTIGTGASLFWRTSSNPFTQHT